MIYTSQLPIVTFVNYNLLVTSNMLMNNTCRKLKVNWLVFSSRPTFVFVSCCVPSAHFLNKMLFLSYFYNLITFFSFWLGCITFNYYDKKKFKCENQIYLSCITLPRDFARKKIIFNVLLPRAIIYFFIYGCEFGKFHGISIVTLTVQRPFYLFLI